MSLDSASLSDGTDSSAVDSSATCWVTARGLLSPLNAGMCSQGGPPSSAVVSACLLLYN